MLISRLEIARRSVLLPVPFLDSWSKSSFIRRVSGNDSCLHVTKIRGCTPADEGVFGAEVECEGRVGQELLAAAVEDDACRREKNSFSKNQTYWL